jgi:hypothetical protein
MVLTTPFYITQHDLQPYYKAQAKDTDGAIDLTGATIYCTMKTQDGVTTKISRQMAGITIDPDQTTNKGNFRYEWQGTDTDAVANYFIEFEINPATGGKFTLPQSPDIAEVKVVSGLDTT